MEPQNPAAAPSTPSPTPAAPATPSPAPAAPAAPAAPSPAPAAPAAPSPAPKSVRAAVMEAVSRDARAQELESGKPDRLRDPATGKFVSAPGAEPKKGEGAPGAVPVPAPAAAARTPPTPSPQPAPDGKPLGAEPQKPPQAWRALAREHWSKVPPEVQEELLRREREVNTRLAETARYRDDARWLTEATRPFEHQLRASGATGRALVENLLQTVQQLQGGSPQTRAKVAAAIVRGYGVDVNMLADALDGAPPGAAADGAADPRVDQLAEVVSAMREEQLRRHREAEAAEDKRLEQHYAEFAKTHEFFSDVRSKMGDLVAFHESQGVDISDEEAYRMAVNLDPELAELARQREEAKRAANPEGSTQRALEAAVSIRPTSTERVGAPAGGGATVRSAVVEAIRRHNPRA